MSCSSSHRTVPVAASRPNALAGEHDRVHLATMLSGLSRSGFARARRAAALRHAADGVAVHEDHGGSRSTLGERVMTT